MNLSVALAILLVGFGGGFFFEKHFYDSYREEVAVAGKLQEIRTKERVKQNILEKEKADETWKTIHARDTTALATARLQLAEARRSGRLVPPAASDSDRDKRICYPDRAQLDREVSAALDEAANEALRDSTEGQAGVDVAVVCKGWAASSP